MDEEFSRMYYCGWRSMSRRYSYTIINSSWNRRRSIFVDENGQEQQANQLNFSVNLAFDRCRNLYTSDKNNHRVQKFSIDHHL
jgi:hypothetical protein